MITLYHSPRSRSTSVLSLLRLMGKETEVKVQTIQVKRRGGLGDSDPRNPHPEGKVPVLEVDGRMIRERAAIMLWLTDHFDSALGRGISSPVRGDYLSWLFYYGNVMEPLMYLSFLEVTDNPMVNEWCRDNAAMYAALEVALSGHDFLVDDQISAADILVASPFTWIPDMVPDSEPIRNWLSRCEAAQDMAWLAEVENAGLRELGLADEQESA
ncbi:glutathione S-transferase family protein [Yoonia sediminilitoris]|uniref:Glutathione S-transferase n=1 Tax=Yoonia sediminilitoris TaxID=1286148 RepID=A0A2T6KQ12_9RHOB|nr:glutathione S-transferase family protein [Yoonia sediminilitoris]PUB18643.1 glutathione S-transferase [Yoonia sediminilitoris]RCW98811.1 glutathione S-transferase [Yoonia sediminilitoris]